MDLQRIARDPFTPDCIEAEYFISRSLRYFDSLPDAQRNRPEDHEIAAVFGEDAIVVELLWPALPYLRLTEEVLRLPWMSPEVADALVGNIWGQLVRIKALRGKRLSESFARIQDGLLKEIEVQVRRYAQKRNLDDARTADLVQDTIMHLMTESRFEANVEPSPRPGELARYMSAAIKNFLRDQVAPDGFELGGAVDRAWGARDGKEKSGSDFTGMHGIQPTGSASSRRKRRLKNARRSPEQSDAPVSTADSSEVESDRSIAEVARLLNRPESTIRKALRSILGIQYRDLPRQGRQVRVAVDLQRMVEAFLKPVQRRDAASWTPKEVAEGFGVARLAVIAVIRAHNKNHEGSDVILKKRRAYRVLPHHLSYLATALGKPSK